jgi:hypothetical protein
MAGLAISLILAAILGFAAHRASVCTVRAVAETMHARTGFMAASIGKSVLWILLIILPVYWLLPETTESLVGWQLSATAVAGGFLFGLGAGVNGACAYSTMARLVDGEAAMLVAIAGFAIGIGVFVGLLDLGWLARPVKVPPMIGAALEWAALLALLLLAWAVYEAVRLWRTRDRGLGFHRLCLSPTYRLSSAALLIGVCGAAIFFLFGSAGYSTTFGLVVEGAFGTRPWPTAGRWLLVVAVLLGMLISTLQRQAFRPRLRPQASWLRNLGGGVLMGLGVAMAPGGNDAFILYGVPNLSPNAVPAFAAMTMGIIAAIVLLRLAFGIETRASCRGDMFVADSWTPEGTSIGMEERATR